MKIWGVGLTALEAGDEDQVLAPAEATLLHCSPQGPCLHVSLEWEKANLPLQALLWWLA